jgi:O-succinylbenzoic acid--CoA ligase
MSDSLSIRAAAAEAGDAIALSCGGRAYSFAELASRVAAEVRDVAHAYGDARPYPLVATGELATVVTLLALLELRVPALLLHPRLTPAERDAILADAARRGSAVHPDAAAIIHTSGTTGTPRGAVLTRAALVASARASAANLGWEAEDCWLACMPLARVGGLSILTRCLAARRKVALAEFDVDGFPALVEAEGVTLASLVPTMLARVLDAHPQWTPPPRLRAVLVGGAAAPVRLLERAAARRVPVVVTYGLTETCSQVAATPYADRFAAAACGAGRPLQGAELRVVDGRIEVRGPMRMAGYWDGAPLVAAEWFDTGDLGAIDARGFLHVNARRGDLIVTGGENVYPAEVERELERCPGIVQALVFGLPDDTWGQTVAAALVVDPAHGPSDGELAAWFGARLAPHKRPRRVCRVERLPQTAAGKPDRAALAAFAPRLRALDAAS